MSDQWWLVVYIRSLGRLVKLEPFSDSRKGLKERFRLEREFKGEADIEIVLLGGSLDQLKRTHSRYFCADNNYSVKLDGDSIP